MGKKGKVFQDLDDPDDVTATAVTEAGEGSAAAPAAAKPKKKAAKKKGAKNSGFADSDEETSAPAVPAAAGSDDDEPVPARAPKGGKAAKSKKKGGAPALSAFDLLAAEDGDAPAAGGDDSEEEEVAPARKPAAKAAAKAKKGGNAAPAPLPSDEDEDDSADSEEDAALAAAKAAPAKRAAPQLVYAEVRSVRVHPKADKLRVCQVEAAESTSYTVITNALEVAVGMKVVFAPVGMTTPGSGIKIEKRTLKGVDSFGMLCSAYDIGWSQEADGVLVVLPPSFAPGTPCPLERPAAAAAHSAAPEPPAAAAAQAQASDESVALAAELGGGKKKKKKGGMDIDTVLAAMADGAAEPAAEAPAAAAASAAEAVEADAEDLAAAFGGKKKKKAGKAGGVDIDSALAALSLGEDGGGASAGAAAAAEEEAVDATAGGGKKKKKKGGLDMDSMLAALAEDGGAASSSAAASTSAAVASVKAPEPPKVDEAKGGKKGKGKPVASGGGDDAELEALLAQLDAPKAPPAASKKKKKGGKGGDAAAGEDVDALAAGVDGPKGTAAVAPPAAGGSGSAASLTAPADAAASTSAAAADADAAADAADGDDNDADDGVAVLGADGKELSAAAKKKLKKKAKEKEKKAAGGDAEAAPKKGGKPGVKESPAVRMMREQLEARRLADDAAAKAEAERKLIEDAEIAAFEEEETRKAKAKEIKKERERLKKEALRKEGKLLTGKAKAEQERLAAIRTQLLAKAGFDVSAPADNEDGSAPKAKKVVYGTKKVKKDPAALAAAAAEEEAARAAAEAADAEAKAEAEATQAASDAAAAEAAAADEAAAAEEAAAVAAAAAAAQAAEDDAADDWDALDPDDIVLAPLKPTAEQAAAAAAAAAAAQASSLTSAPSVASTSSSLPEGAAAKAAPGAKPAVPGSKAAAAAAARAAAQHAAAKAAKAAAAARVAAAARSLPTVNGKAAAKLPAPIALPPKKPAAKAKDGDAEDDDEESGSESDDEDGSGSESGSESESEASSSESESESDSDTEYSSSESDSDDSDDVLNLKIEEARAKRLARSAAAREKADPTILRSPICCILGHVDVGKTKILDNIRRTNVQDGEAGGITQQIGATFMPADAVERRTAALRSGPGEAFDMKIPGLLVIDTPGHESFTNLRTRGSGLCDIAVLVVDLMHGLEQQTIESIGLLKSRKTPFIIALNKVDRLYGWKSLDDAPIRDAFAAQKDFVAREFEDRSQKVFLELNEQGLNVALYYKNPDSRKYVSVVPTSAITGEGIPDLLQLIVKLTQSMMAERLMYVADTQCTVLEVKNMEGLGTTVDVVLVNGTLKEGDPIVVCGLNGPLITRIKALKTPQVMKEMRVKGMLMDHKEIRAAMGVKIVAPGLELAVAGTQLYIIGPDDDEDDLKDAVMADMADIFSKVDKGGEGVCVQASTLGSLEALLTFLSSKDVNIPVSGINIGQVHKRDVLRANVMNEKKVPKYACILAFDVPVSREARDVAEEYNVKVFTADIIYHLFDQFTAYMKEFKLKEQEAARLEAVFPCILRILPTCIFNKKDPIVLGVDILEGIAKVGCPVCVPSKEGIELGRIASMELNHKPVDTAKAGQSVAMKIEGTNAQEQSRLYGRHFDHTDQIVSLITRESIDALKTHFKEEMGKEDWRLVVKLKGLFHIT